jgi:hypothetical protein
MSETESERAQGGAYPSELDGRGRPNGDGQLPRPASEPEGAKGSSHPDPGRASDESTARETVVDPATGAPLDES